MRILTAATEIHDSVAAVADLAERIVTGLDGPPDFLLLAYGEGHDPHLLRSQFAAHFPQTVLLGSSTCRGVMTGEGLFGFRKPVLGGAAFVDPDAAFGTATLTLDGDVQAAIKNAIETAQAAADRRGEVPDMVWLHASPGTEETVICGVQESLGSNVLISGGSSADETIGGKWSQFNTDAIAGDAVIALIYTDLPVTHHFQNGYLPSNFKGEITRAEGRVLHEIGGRPAAEVYNEWTGGRITDALADRSKNILGDSAWHPLGKSIGRVGPSPELMVDCYCLLHPDSVGPNGELHLFANVSEGSQVVLMNSGPQELIKRSTQVVRISMEMMQEEAPIAGGLMVFCAGCMLALGDDIALAAEAIGEAYSNVPFLGVFTFGEQGSFLNGDRLHGNLMISSSLFAGDAEVP
ncbi:MAG: FIST N-terminal domain-containing protein [Paracoccaceae bacterium]|nr:FIST N-terminal domain-containing protein [Paracoccaceae bacterium]